MKQTLLSLAALMWPVFLFAQKTIVSPDHGMSNSGNLTIEKIELTDTATVFSFHYTGREGQWMSVPTKAYVQLPDSDDHLYATGTDGIPFGERYYMTETEEVSYRVCFPPVPEETALLHFGEDVPRGAWHIYDIQLKEPEHLLPAYVRGHFFDSYTGLYAASVLRDQVVYNQKVWAITASNVKKDRGSLKLQSGDEKLVLYFARDKDFLQLGPDKEHLQSLSKRRNRMAVARNGNVDLETPEFSLDSAEYSGYVIGFNPKYSTNKFTIYSDNIMSGRQEKVEVEIDPQGYFSSKVPVYYPHQVYLSGVARGEYPFLAPGKSLFHVIDLTSTKQERLYLGETAAISSELIAPHRITNMSQSKAKDATVGRSFDAYRNWCLELEETDLENLAKLYDEGKLSKRAYQLHQLDVLYACYDEMLNYEFNWQMKYKDENKGSYREAREYFYQHIADTLSIDRKGMITKELVNNPMGKASIKYRGYLQAVLNSLSRPGVINYLPISAQEIVDSLEVRGIQLTAGELETVNVITQLEVLGATPEYRSFQSYAKQERDFLRKYKKEYDALIKVYAPERVEMVQLKNYLNELGITLTEEETELVDNIIVWRNSEPVQQVVAIHKIHGDSITAFNERYRDLRDEISEQKRWQQKIAYLDENFGISYGLLIDFVACRPYASQIASQYQPLTEDDLKKLESKVDDDFFIAYLEAASEALKQEIARYATAESGNIRSVPEVANDKLFDSIIGKYKGKLVYVDFWATWCGPCQAGIRQIAPLKSELAEKNIVFVYITNESSPDIKWRPQTAGISGEHYRLSNEQWRALCDQFEISGIPHCVLVDADGKVVNPHLSHMSNTGLKLLFEKYLNSEQSSIENTTNPSN